MEGPAPAETPPKESRRRVLVILVVVLVVAGVATWWFILRVRSIAEVLAMDHLQPGSQVQVQGTITSILWDNTSYEPRAVLGLDNEPTCRELGNVFGDPRVAYTVGQTFQTTLHFESYVINGDPGVWAPELACPFPRTFDSIAKVGDAVSTVTGMFFAYNGTDAGGWSHFEVVALNGASVEASRLPVDLRKSTPIPGNNPGLPAGGPVDSAARWRTLADLEYLGLAGAYQLFPIVDRMASLSSGSSANGTLRFLDANGNGLLDDGDRVDVRTPSLPGANAWDVYQLVIGGVADPYRRYMDVIHLFLNGPAGPFDTPILARTVPLLDLGYSQAPTGGPYTSTVTVTRVRFGTAPPVSQARYALGSAAGALAGLPVTLPGGETLSFSDANSDGRLDVGDVFTVTNLSNLTAWWFVLQVANATIALMSWVAGYGPVFGQTPMVNATGSGTAPWRVTVNVPYWAPPFLLGGTLRITLLQNFTPVLQNVTLRPGSIGTFANGSLVFTDADRDGYLSTGDYFTVTGSPADLYRLNLSVLYAPPYGLWSS